MKTTGPKYTTLKDALYDTVHNTPTPLKAMAEELGCKYSTLANSVNPNIPGLEFQLSRLIPVCRMSGNLAVLDYIEHALGRVAINLPTAPKCLDALNKELLKTIKEFSDLTQVAAKDLVDGHCSHKDAAEIEKEGLELVQQVMTYIEAAKSAAANGGKLR